MGLSVILFGIFLVPTDYTFIRQQILPSLVSPVWFIEGIITVVIIAGIFQNKISRPSIPGVLLLSYIGFVCLLLLSLLYTPNLEYGAQKAAEFVTMNTLACFAPLFLFRESADIHRFFKTLIAISVILIGLLLRSHPLSPSVSFNSPVGSNYLALEHILGMTGLIVLYYYLMIEQIKLHGLGWVLFIFTMISAMIYSGGKAPIVSFYSAVSLALVVSIKIGEDFKEITIDRRILRSTLLAFIAGTSSVVFFVFVLNYSALLNRTQKVLDVNNYSQIERLHNSKIAVGLFLDHPIGGVGGSFGDGHFQYRLSSQGAGKGGWCVHGEQPAVVDDAHTV